MPSLALIEACRAAGLPVRETPPKATRISTKVVRGLVNPGTIAEVAERCAMRLDGVRRGVDRLLKRGEAIRCGGEGNDAVYVLSEGKLAMLAMGRTRGGNR